MGFFKRINHIDILNSCCSVDKTVEGVKQIQNIARAILARTNLQYLHY
jgi:hypothetical protein